MNKSAREYLASLLMEETLPTVGHGRAVHDGHWGETRQREEEQVKTLLVFFLLVFFFFFLNNPTSRDVGQRC